MTSGISSNSLAIDGRTIPLLRSLENSLIHVYYKYCAPLELSLAAILSKTSHKMCSPAGLCFNPSTFSRRGLAYVFGGIARGDREHEPGYAAE